MYGQLHIILTNRDHTGFITLTTGPIHTLPNGNWGYSGAIFQIQQETPVLFHLNPKSMAFWGPKK